MKLSPKELSKKLKSIREQKKLTQEEVAKKAGMTANYYAKLERGLHAPGPDKVYSISKALGVKVSDIFPD